MLPSTRRKESQHGTYSGPQGDIIANCFACGANGMDLADALGINKSELFAQPLQKGQDRHWQLNSTTDSDDGFIVIHESALKRGEKPRYDDMVEYKQAKARRAQRSALGLEQTIIPWEKL
jgi:hypothetical protein